MKQNFNKILEKVLREVKFLARISHPNIIRYYNSWIELRSTPNFPIDSLTDSIVEEKESQSDIQEKDLSFEIMWDFSEATKLESSLENTQLKHAKSFDFNETNNTEIIIFIQTELCDETLEEYLLRRNATLFELKKNCFEKYQTEKKNYLREAKKIFHQIISGLSYIHSNCCTVHRDLKTTNIYLNRNLNVKLGDFGLAKQLQPFTINNKIDNNQKNLSFSPPSLIFYKNLNHQTLNRKFSSLFESGKNIYMSPEQLKGGDNFDQRTDIYSLGVIALRLFHPMATVMEFFEVVKDIKSLRIIADEKKELSVILSRMISQKPNERPNLKEVKETFDRIFEEDILLNSIDYQNLGMNQVKSEGETMFLEKWLKIINKKLYFYKSCNDKKAEKVYNLEECNIILEKNKEFINIDHPFQIGCCLRTIGKQQLLTENLFKIFQRLFDNRKDLINFSLVSNALTQKI